MTAARYVAGWALLASAFVPLALGSWRLRRRLLPDWSGAPARLAEAIIGSSLLFAVAQFVGAIGAFSAGPLFPACAGVGLAVALLAKPRPRAASPGESIPPSRPSDRVGVIVATMTVALLAAQWGTRVLDTFRRGILDADSLQYHLPIAARFVQTGWITRIHFLDPNDPNRFHPANSELLHSVGMLAFGRDLLSPLLNVAWAAFLLLAVWCIGRPRGAGPTAVVGAGILLTTPVIALGAGAALSDVASIAFLLAAVALLLQPGGGPRAILVAGAAAGLSASTKLTVLPAVGALAVALIVVFKKRERLDVLTHWAPALAVTGSFWYVRNLVRTGNPVPAFNLGVGSLSLSSIGSERAHQRRFSVAHYIGNLHVWRSWFIPGLNIAMSPAWWAILALAGAGMIGALFTGEDLTTRIVGGVAIFTAVAYAFNPTSALGFEGQPAFFALNVRYVFPAIALGLTLLPTLPFVASPLRQRSLLAVFGVLVLVTETAGGDLPGFPGVIRAWPAGHRLEAAVIGLGVVGLVAALAYLRGSIPPRPLVAAVGALVSVALVLGLFAEQEGYYRDRYPDRAVAKTFDRLDRARVAVTTSIAQYLYYGRNLTSYVQLVGKPGLKGLFRSATTCDEWRQLLDAGSYDYVVVPKKAIEMRWVRSSPAAAPYMVTPRESVFRLYGPLGTKGCP